MATIESLPSEILHHIIKMVILDYPATSAITIDSGFWKIQSIERTRETCERFFGTLSLVLVSKRFAICAASCFAQLATAWIPLIFTVEKHTHNVLLRTEEMLERIWGRILRIVPRRILLEQPGLVFKLYLRDSARRWKWMVFLEDLEANSEGDALSKALTQGKRKSSELIKEGLETKWNTFYEIEYLMRPLFEKVPGIVSLTSTFDISCNVLSHGLWGEIGVIKPSFDMTYVNTERLEGQEIFARLDYLVDPELADDSEQKEGELADDSKQEESELADDSEQEKSE